MTEPPEDVDEPLLTVEDVAAWFRVHRSWVYDEVEAGRLPFVRLGRQHLRFRRAELQQFLQARSRQPLLRRPRPPRSATSDLEPLD